MSDRLEAAMAELAAAIRAEVRASAVTAPPRLLSIAEATRMCGVSRAQFYKLIGSGAIRTRKVGSRRLIPESAITAFIEGSPEAGK